MSDQKTNIQELKNQVFKLTQERNWEEYHNPKKYIHEYSHRS